MADRLCKLEISSELILALLKVEEKVTVKEIYVNEDCSVVGLVLKGDKFPELEEGELIPLAEAIHYPAKTVIKV